MDILQETHGQVLLVAPSGRLDSETAGELELVLHDAQTAGRRHFVIDMAAVSYVSSAGLRLLLALAKRLDGGLGSIRLCGMNASVRQVFDISGFTSMFALFPGRKAALDRHPHMLDTSDALVDAAAALLGATKATPSAPVDSAQATLAAGLLGATIADASAPKSSTVIGPAVAEPKSDKSAGGGRWKIPFGKN